MNEQENLDSKLVKYRSLTQEALAKVSVKKGIGEKEKAMAEKLLEMAKSYFHDAGYFEEKNMPLTALAAYSYAHAWIDAGVRLGLLDGKGDDKLFILP